MRAMSKLSKKEKQQRESQFWGSDFPLMPLAPPERSTGNYENISSCNDFVNMYTSGTYSKAVSAGAGVNINTEDKEAHGAVTGISSRCLTQGDNANSIGAHEDTLNETFGNCAHAINVGKGSKAITHGKQAIAVALGKGSRVSAKALSWIVLAKYWDDKLVEICTARVGIGEIDDVPIKPDTWYWFEDGELKSEPVTTEVPLRQ